MFTGLVEELGRVVESSPLAVGKRLVIESPLPGAEIALGDSVAVDGVCLTVVAKGQQRLSFDVSQESLSRSTLGERRVGDAVHLERAMRLGDRLGGHLVQGHVDAVGRITGLSPLGEAVRVEFACPASVGRYLIEKGSIAVDGVSLTVNERADQGFSVVLVPHTQEKTALAKKGVGGKVNLEVDLIAKYVERLLPQRGGEGLSVDFLREHGFAPKE